MHCSLVAVLLALLVAVAAALPPASLPAPVQDCTAAAEGCEAGEPSPVALMQLHLDVRAGGPSSAADEEEEEEESDEPVAYGRTVLSTNPRATAEWMAKYYDNTEILPSIGDCDEVERAAVLLNLGFGKTQLMVFVKPKSSSLGSDLDPNVMIPRIEQTVAEMFEGKSNYTSWLDSHDGFRANSFSTSEAFEDGYKVGVFMHDLESGSLTTQQYVMFFFPHTMYGIQNVVSNPGGQDDRTDVPDGMQTFVMQDCRDGASGTDENPSLLDRGTRRSEPHSQYWKGTFMANNPGTALDFVVSVLNTSVGDSPYAWPPKAGCTGATWAQFAISRFQLHFVNSQQYETRPDMIKDFTEKVLSVRDLKADSFDPHMYNSFIWKVKSLDPYVERLRAQSIDFLLVNAGKGEYALFASIPDNDITFQFRSSHVSVEVPAPLEMCSQQFGNY